jgi:hypothetical protein
MLCSFSFVSGVVALACGAALATSVGACNTDDVCCCRRPSNNTVTCTTEPSASCIDGAAEPGPCGITIDGPGPARSRRSRQR